MKNAVFMDMEKVEQLSHEHLWTWAELARRSSVTQSTLFALKAGRRRASMITACKIAHALNVEPQVLIKEEG